MNNYAHESTPPPPMNDDPFEDSILEQYNNFENLNYELIKGKIALFSKKN